MKTKFKIFLTFMALGVIFLIGCTAALISDLFGWISNQCQDWFDEIYGSEN